MFSLFWPIQDDAKKVLGFHRGPKGVDSEKEASETKPWKLNASSNPNKAQKGLISKIQKIKLEKEAERSKK